MTNRRFDPSCQQRMPRICRNSASRRSDLATLHRLPPSARRLGSLTKKGNSFSPNDGDEERKADIAKSFMTQDSKLVWIDLEHKLATSGGKAHRGFNYVSSKMEDVQEGLIPPEEQMIGIGDWTPTVFEFEPELTKLRATHPTIASDRRNGNFEMLLIGVKSRLTPLLIDGPGPVGRSNSTGMDPSGPIQATINERHKNLFHGGTKMVGSPGSQFISSSNHGSQSTAPRTKQDSDSEADSIHSSFVLVSHDNKD